MKPEDRERYVRWQNYRINQLTFSINLFLGFAVASLAYAINIKVTTQPSSINPEIFCTIYWWSASAVLGTIASLSRLLDFRHTARKIKDFSECDKKTAKFFGKVTWRAFWMQVITYVTGGYVFINNVVFS